MSNNSNNIYNILGKLAALQPTAQEKHDATVKAIYESVEAQGSITEGVSSVEQKLMEKYMGFDKTVAAIKKGGSAENPEAVAAAIGRKKYGKAKFQKAAAAGKKLGEDYDRVADVKNIAQEYMQSNGIQSVHDLEPEDIEYIGQECQCNYAGVCEILGCELPDSLGPVQSYDDEGDLEEKAPPGAKAERMVKHIKQGYAKDGKLTDKEKAIAYATTWAAHNKGQVEEEMCEACGQTMEGCGCDHTNEAEITRKPGVTTHRKTEFPGYPADDIDDLDDLRGPGTGKRGRPRKHAAKAPTGLGRGRPVKAAAPSYSKQADPFGRVSGTVPKGKKGTVHTMAESMNNLGRKLIEGINFTNMMKETDQTIDELMTELQNDIKEYKATGHCSDKLKDFMQVHAHSKKQMADEMAATPPAVPPVPQGIPGNVPIPGKMDRLSGGRDYYEEEEVTMEDELNELARLAGVTTSEGNAFTGKLANTPKGSEFELDGKTFKDTSSLGDTELEEDDMEEGNEFSGELAKAKATHQKEFEVDGKTYPVKESTTFDECDMSSAGEFNINTSMSGDGDKSVTVTATGDQAAELLQMLRIAGLGGTSKAQELQTEPEVEVVSLGAPEEVMDEEGIEVDQPEVAPQNAPNEKYGTIKNITTQGDDLNREKSQDPATANKAANPMTNAQSVLKAVAQLESKLAKEYESIKKVSK